MSAVSYGWISNNSMLVPDKCQYKLPDRLTYYMLHVGAKNALLGIVVENDKCGVPNNTNVLSMIVTINKNTATFEL